MFSINERFRTIFRESGLSQEKFAEKIKRSRGEVANIIYDKTVPKDQIIKSTCEAFGIQEDWLRHGIGSMRVPRSEEEEIGAMVSSVLNGPPDFQRAVVKMICSRTPEELKVLEKAFMDILESIKKE